MLVDHALARFSTDNLSCMVVRLDSKALLEATMEKADLIGVEGDKGSAKGGISESEAIVREARDKVAEGEKGGSGASASGEDLTKVVELEEGGEPGPELTTEGVVAEPLSTTK
jgi:protein phosphatase PTC1